MSRRDSEKRLNSWSPYVVGGAFALAALSQARVQIFARDNLLDYGEKSGRFLVKSPDPARRGSILDSSGRPLAQNEDGYEFGVVFDKVPDSDAFFIELSDASGIPAAQMRQLKESGAANAFWPVPLSRVSVKAVQNVKTRWRADGVSIGPSKKRSYALAEAAAGFIGYMRNGEPAAGLERSQEELLSGVDGLSIGVTDRMGAFLPMRMDSRSKERVDGKPITLTIDSTMQLAATSALKRAVEGNRARQGAVVVMDPKTGNILAMANWPSIDPDRIGEPTGKDQRVSDFNPNYMAALEPGSMFKILTLALSLDDGVVTPEDTWNCKGAFTPWPGYTIHCDAHHGVRAHGAIHPMDAIARSCNVSAANWALKIGFEDFAKFLDASGIMSRTHLGVPLEAKGNYQRGEYAKRLQLATMGFGQSITGTPVGLASAISALANGGVRMEPRLIMKTGEKPNPPKEAGRLFSAQSAKTVLGFMEQTFESKNGTAHDLRISGYRMAGKTGTAQKINKNDDGYVSNFVGVLPAEDPKVVILVMVDRPSGARYYGASVAGPAYEEIARAAIRRYGIAKSKPSEPEVSVHAAPIQSDSEVSKKDTGHEGVRATRDSSQSKNETVKLAHSPTVSVSVQPIRMKGAQEREGSPKSDTRKVDKDRQRVSP